MPIDKRITLHNPRTGQSADGYYGFSRETLRSLGFVWFKRGDMRLFAIAMTPLIDFVLVPSALLLLPDVREMLFSTGLLPIPGADIPLLAYLLLFLGLLSLCCMLLIAANINRLYTTQLLKKGYALPAAAINLDEARAALKLPPSRTST